MSSKGFLIYAHNNAEIDYGKIALCSSLMLKARLKENNVCLVTDPGTHDWLKQSLGNELVDYAFQDIRLLDWSFKEGAQERLFRDTMSTSKNMEWYNGSRINAFKLTPYDETIVLDSDFLVQDSMFDLVWGNHEDFLINKQASTLRHDRTKPAEQRLDSTTIPMYWATMMYFRKSERAQLLFSLAEHIKENYEYYQYVYEFPGKLFRNDYVFSIAVHMLNGFLENNEFKSFPQPSILSSFDVDDLIDVDQNSMTFLAQDSEETWRFHQVRMKNLNVHVMNKYAILRQADKIIELFKP